MLQFARTWFAWRANHRPGTTERGNGIERKHLPTQHTSSFNPFIFQRPESRELTRPVQDHAGIGELGEICRQMEICKESSLLYP